MPNIFLPWKEKETFLKAASAIPWANKIIESPPIEEYLIDQFCIETEWKDNTSVNLSLVVGSIHPDYKEHSWLWLLKHGKRMRENLSLLFSNPQYYFTEDKKLPAMSYLDINNKYYVFIDGNHRTCIAKFLFYLLNIESVLSGVETYRKVLDIEALKAWKHLGGPECRVLISRKKIFREDGSGWMREYYELRFTVFKGKRCYQNLSSKELIELSQKRKRKRNFIAKVKTKITKLFQSSSLL